MLLFQHLRSHPLHLLWLSGRASALSCRSESLWGASEPGIRLPVFCVPASQVRAARRSWTTSPGLTLAPWATLSLIATPKGSRCGLSFEEQYLGLRSQSSLQLFLWCALLCHTLPRAFAQLSHKPTTARLRCR